MKRILSVFLSIAIVILTANPVTVKAYDNKIKDLNFDQLGEEGKEAYLYVEESNHFSVMSDLVITYSYYISDGIVEKCEGLTFKSSNETVLKLLDGDYGVFEALTPGEANIIISYPGIDSLTLKVNVIEKGSYDKDGKYRALSEKLDTLYSVELVTDNIINYYNELLNVSQQMVFSNEDHYLANPNVYIKTLAWNRIRAYLESVQAIYYSYTPFSVKKISSIKKNSIKVLLSRKLDDNDIVSYCMVNDIKYTKNLKMDYRAIFLDGKNGAKNPYDANYIGETYVKLEKGCNSFTVKLPSTIKKGHTYSVVMSIDEENGFTWTKGKYFKAK